MALTKSTYRMTSGESANVLDFGADPLGVADSTTAIQAALDSGASSVVFPKGTFLTTGVEVKSTSSVVSIKGTLGSILKLTTGTDRSAITLGKAFVNIDGLYIQTTGNSSDGNNTCGIQALSKAYITLTNLRILGFSKAGINCEQGVYWSINNCVVQSSTYGISITPHPTLAAAATTISINKAYITGCTRGVSSSCVLLNLRDVVFEYCGSSSTVDGAFHSNGGGASLRGCYWEANERNIVAIESPLQIIQSYQLAATAANSFTYVGTTFNLRGNTQIGANKIRTRFINADDLSNYDLVIGENLTAPVAGGSVDFGGMTAEQLSGTATSGTWTTIKSFPANDMSGSVHLRASYIYTVHAGYADLGTGFDSGTILNGTAYSNSGSLPAWLRMSGNDLQVNITSSSYGLFWGLTLQRISANNI